MTIYEFFDNHKATTEERLLLIQYLAVLRMKATLLLPTEPKRRLWTPDD